jgi:hypothetical protein
LILDVLDGMGGNAVRGEKPVQVAGASAIKSELHRCARQSGNESRFEIYLKGED